MAYVPPEVKERIKREVSIQRLAEARGIKLRRVGRSLMGLHVVIEYGSKARGHVSASSEQA